MVFVTAAHDRDLLLRAFDAGVVDYVTKPFLPEELLARVNAHVGLKLTRDRLERVAREREELVNLVAHDLKNPLSSVLFASDLLRSGGCKPERVPRYLQMIHESADDALGYIRHYLESQAGQRRRDRRSEPRRPRRDPGLAAAALRDPAGGARHPRRSARRRRARRRWRSTRACCARSARTWSPTR